MPYIDKDFKPTVFEYTNVNDYNRLLVYYPRKGGRTTPSITPTITPSPSFVLECHIEAQNGDFIIAQNGDYIDHFPCPDPSPTPSITASITTTPTPTPSSSAPAFDADAAAYLADVITSGGTVDATMSAATNTLFTDLKSNSLYTKMLAFYPYVGGTAASHAINAKLNKSYDITWNGGMTHGVSGSTGNNSNSYGDTGFNNNTWAQDNMSFGVYCVTNLSSTGNDQLFGYTESTEEPAVQIAPGAGGGSVSYFRCGNAAGTIYNHGGIPYRGNYIATRTGSTAGYLYRNATLWQTDSNTYTKDASGRSVYVFAIRIATGFFDPTPDTLSFTFVGDGLSTTEVSTLDGIINTFQTSLGRNTY
jgi:hypothetical protein